MLGEKELGFLLKKLTLPKICSSPWGSQSLLLMISDSGIFTAIDEDTTKRYPYF